MIGSGDLSGILQVSCMYGSAWCTLSRTCVCRRGRLTDCVSSMTESVSVLLLLRGRAVLC